MIKYLSLYSPLPPPGGTSITSWYWFISVVTRSNQEASVFTPWTRMVMLRIFSSVRVTLATNWFLVSVVAGAFPFCRSGT